MSKPKPHQAPARAPASAPGPSIEDAQRAPTQPPPPPVVTERVKRHVVAKGRSITSPRGILPPGEVLRSTDLDEASLAALVAAGVVAEVSE